MDSMGLRQMSDVERIRAELAYVDRFHLAGDNLTVRCRTRAEMDAIKKELTPDERMRVRFTHLEGK